MRPSKRADRAMQELAKLLATHGVKDTVIEEIKEVAPTNRDAISRQGEAVLLFLEQPAKFTAKLCKRCEEPFGTNYRSVGYCSDTCRSKAISEQLGVKWDFMKTSEERWGGEPPLVIPPKALEKIRQYVSWFDNNLPTQNQIQNPPESIPQVSPVPVSEIEKSIFDFQE